MPQERRPALGPTSTPQRELVQPLDCGPEASTSCRALGGRSRGSVCTRESEAEADGILVSDVVRQAVAGKDFEFEDRCEVALKGFDEPVRA